MANEFVFSNIYIMVVHKKFFQMAISLGDNMYRVTIEEYKDGYGWVQIQKTTDKNVWGQFINLSAFSKIVGLTRAQIRYQLGL